MLVPGGSLQPLRHSRDEVKQISTLYRGQAEVYVGADATEEQAKAIGPDVRFLHFAVHGLLDEKSPLNSALVLSTPSASNSTENGYLQAWELYQNVHWDAELVVLSACEAALGQEVQGEGLMGLTRAVHYAGARSVLGTLWGVDDHQTEYVMTHFYSEMQAGKSKDEALRAAQLHLLHSRGGASPFYWAAFSLDGDWR